MIAANNSIFFNATRTKEERSRILPEPPCCKDGKIIVLLEHIGTGGMEQVAYDMADSFAKQGRSVLLASFHAPEKGIKIPENLLLYVLDENDQEGDWQKLLSKEKCAAVFAHYCTRGAAAAAEQQIPYFQVIHNTYCWFGEDLYNALLEQEESEAKHVATALEIYVHGSLNVFIHIGSVVT